MAAVVFCFLLAKWEKGIGGKGSKKLGAPFYYMPLRVSTPRKQSSFAAPCHYVAPAAGRVDEKWRLCGLNDS